jgi:hypothetical protein
MFHWCRSIQLIPAYMPGMFLTSCLNLLTCFSHILTAIKKKHKLCDGQVEQQYTQTSWQKRDHYPGQPTWYDCSFWFHLPAAHYRNEEKSFYWWTEIQEISNLWSFPTLTLMIIQRFPKQWFLTQLWPRHSSRKMLVYLQIYTIKASILK